MKIKYVRRFCDFCLSVCWIPAYSVNIIEGSKICCEKCRKKMFENFSETFPVKKVVVKGYEQAQIDPDWEKI